MCTSGLTLFPAKRDSNKVEKLGVPPQECPIKEEAMKKNVSPGVVVLVIAVVVIVIALLFYKGAAGGAKAKQQKVEDAERTGNPYMLQHGKTAPPLPDMTKPAPTAPAPAPK
jgi:hypothetical protein